MGDNKVLKDEKTSNSKGGEDMAKRNKKKKFWRGFFDYLSWIILIFILIYGLLKLFGVLHSFDWVIVVGGSIVVGRYMQKIDMLIKDVERIKKHCPNCEV